jgi:hypothetical protein
MREGLAVGVPRLHSVKPWLQYALIRVGVFAVVFAVLYWLRPDLWWVWAIVAAVISVCVGYIFFGDLRRRMAEDVAARRAAPEPSSDELAEDR